MEMSMLRKEEKKIEKGDMRILLKRAEHFKTILTAEGFVVGIAAGLVVLLYRVLLEYAGRGMELVLDAQEGLSGAGRNLVFRTVCHCLHCGKVGKILNL